MAAGLFGGAGDRPRSASVRSIVFIGVAVLGPVLARPDQPGARCAAAHACGACPAPSPGRTPCGTRSAPSATAAALMIGVALVGFITILAASTKASIDETIDENFHGDLVVDSEAGMGTGGLSPTWPPSCRSSPSSTR